ncbi:MAG: hypothetical protein JWP91_1597 [Fibrobacteres bacterium]|nr:hypothetical protein [Fibrobacterota bacterium]
MSLSHASILSSCIIMLGTFMAEAKGISVRFLAGPAEDSLVRYEIYRSSAPGEPALPIGELPAVKGLDTLSFADESAEKGRSYAYLVKGVNAEGIESDPSDTTLVGYPYLSLPDTLRPDKVTGLIRMVLPAGSDPLRGAVPLSLALLDSSRFSLVFDPASNTATLRARSGRTDTGWAVVRAQYFDKFSDLDSVLILPEPRSTVALSTPSQVDRPQNRLSDGNRPRFLWKGRTATGRFSPDR